MSAASDVDLPEPVGPGEEDEAARLRRELVERGRQAEVLDRLDLGRDHAEGRSERLALVVGADAEAAEAAHAVREVELPVELETLLLLGGRDAVDQLPRRLGIEHRCVLERLDVTVHARDRLRAGGDVQVGGAGLHGALEKNVDGERKTCLTLGVLIRHGDCGIHLHDAVYRQGAAAA